MLGLIIIFVILQSSVFADETILKFSGSGLHDTRPFTTQGPWEIQWEAENKINIYVNDENGFAVPVAMLQTGKGSSYQSKSGKYSLTIQSMGPWKIKIVSVK
jgi:hypothetical protein